MVETVAAATPRALVALTQRYDQAAKEVERLDGLLKVAKVSRSMAEKKLVDEMITQEVESFRSPTMGGFRRQVCLYPNVKDREALNAWIKKQKKLKWLYTVTVNSQKFKGFVRELIENGKPVPPGVDPYVQTEIRRFK